MTQERVTVALRTKTSVLWRCAKSAGFRSTKPVFHRDAPLIDETPSIGGSEDGGDAVRNMQETEGS